jgi:hypothetical protein
MECSKCGTTENVVEINETKICDKCAYYECKTCGRKCTIDDIGVGKCFCKKEDFCFQCEHKFPPAVVCHLCDNKQKFHICNDSECNRLLVEYLKSTREICGFCHISGRCLHPITIHGKDDDPFEEKKSVYCMYKSSEESDWCKKWICPSYVSNSWTWKGFLCKEH